MKSNTKSVKFFDNPWTLPKAPRKTSDLKVHTKEDFTICGRNFEHLMDNHSYLGNKETKIDKYDNIKLATKVMYDAGIRVIQQNPELLTVYNKHFDQEAQGRKPYGLMTCNQDKAIYVILLGLEASRESHGLDAVVENSKKTLKHHALHTRSPGLTVALPNGEALICETKFYDTLFAFLDKHNVDVSDYLYKRGDIYNIATSIIESDINFNEVDSTPAP